MDAERAAHLGVALLGQSSLLDSLAREFRGENSGTTSGVYVVWTLAALAVTVGLWWIAKRHDPGRRRVVDDPRRLFRDLCRVHDLPRRERRRLAAWAAAGGSSEPALLFIEPAHFDVAARAIEDDSERAAIDSLRARLFDEGEEEGNESGRTS